MGLRRMTGDGFATYEGDRVRMYYLKILHPDGNVQHLPVSVSKRTPWTVEFKTRGVTHMFECSSLFECLKALREYWEERSCRVLCKGSRPDVQPSSASVCMGGGQKAYILRLGAPPAKEDLVDIFDEEDALFVGTVLEQQKFQDAYWQSRGILRTASYI